MTAQPGCVRVTKLPDGQGEKSAQFAGGLHAPNCGPSGDNQRKQAQVMKIA
jgi:hypothetical protein